MIGEEGLRKWHEEGAQAGDGFMLVVEDLETGVTFVEYLPVDADAVERIRDYQREFSVRQLCVQACYSLRRPLEDQLGRSEWNTSL